MSETATTPPAAPPRFVIEPLALVVAGALPGLVLGDVISGRATIVAAGAVSLAAGAAAVAAARLGTSRRGALAMLLVGVAGVLAVAAATAAIWPDESGRSVPAAALDGLVHGWATVVTAPVPATAGPRLLVPLVVTVWLATSAAVLLALRTSSRLLPLLPGAVALTLACVAAGRAQKLPLVTGALFVAAAGVVLAARAPQAAAATGPRSRNRSTAVTAALSLLAVTGLAAAAGPVLAIGRDDDPFEPREHIDPPQLPADAENPLDLVAGNLRRPDTELFTITATEHVPIRLVTLDAFDGAAWSVSGTWETAGRNMRVPSRPGASVRQVSADVSIAADGLGGAFLPTLGDTTSVRGVNAIVEPSSGSLAVTGDRVVAGSTYSIVTDYASLVGVGPEQLAALDVATDEEARAASRLPDEPPQLLVDVANVAVDGQTSPLLQARNLAVYLHDGGYTLDLDGRGGHSYYHLLRTLTETQTGTSEQFAAAFAVLGRIVGLPTRIVVGFEADDTGSDESVTVHSGDVVVWPEVKFEGAGWVAFDPTPSDAATDAPDDVATIGGANVQFSPPEPETAQPPREQRTQPDTGNGGGLSIVGRVLAIALAVVAGAAVVALIAGVVVVALKRRLTRRRRRAGDARGQVLGAWHDVLDRLVESGAVAPGARTVEEHIAATQSEAASLSPLYRPVLGALYGGSALAADDSDRAWSCRDQFVRALRRRESWVRRWRQAMSPTTLLHPAGGRPG